MGAQRRAPKPPASQKQHTRRDQKPADLATKQSPEPWPLNTAAEPPHRTRSHLHLLSRQTRTAQRPKDAPNTGGRTWANERSEAVGR